MGGADGRMIGWRVGVDDRELERLTEGVLEEELVRQIAGILEPVIEHRALVGLVINIVQPVCVLSVLPQ
jgi:hypothetical protein